MSLALVLSLVAALTYGTSDFFGGLASRRLNVLHATAGTYVVATVTVGAGLLLVGGVWTVDATWLGALAGLLAVVGFVAFYAALAIGPMSLLSPAIALIGGVVPVAVSAATGQALGVLQWVAIAVAVVATVLISVPSQRSRERVTVRAAVMALIAGLGLGGSVVALDFTSEASGLVPAMVEMLVGVAILLLLIGVLRRTRASFGLLAIFEPPPAAGRQGFTARRAWVLATIAGLLLGVSNSLITIALHEGNLAVVSVLVSLYPLATVVLAAIVLRERLSALQIAGIVLAIAACIALAAG
jgi:drug/metabolite transporter (DMT)-like permease